MEAGVAIIIAERSLRSARMTAMIVRRRSSTQIAEEFR
jgi:hypothetical protein